MLSKYLRAYTRIFKSNQRARYYSITYVDAFAGTGMMRVPALGGFTLFFPELQKAQESLRKGSARRALEVEPGFDKYLFIEKNATKCAELIGLKSEFPGRNIEIINEDANRALLNWCAALNTKRERAVVFLDPFGTSVDWTVISALGKTRAVDLWILFPYSAINRMLIRNRKPPATWADRLTRIFGEGMWQEKFYSKVAYQSILEPGKRVEQTYKSADHREIIDYVVERLRTEFVAVANPIPLRNSKGLLFLLIFAAGNEKGARAGIKIANSIKAV